MNFDAALGCGEVGLGTVVRDSNGVTLMVVEKFQPFIGFEELVEALTLNIPMRSNCS